MITNAGKRIALTILLIIVQTTAFAPVVSPGAILSVDRLDDVGSATACTSAPNDCSLRGAVIHGNTLPGTDTVLVPSGVFTLTVPGTNEDNSATGDLDVKESLVIRGAGLNNTVINGSSIDRVLDILTGTATVTITAVSITGGSVVGNTGFKEGGGVRVNTFGHLVVTDSTVMSNTAGSGSGGGLYNAGALEVVASRILGNTARDGGGIYNETRQLEYQNWLTATASIVSQNEAQDLGGGIYNMGRVIARDLEISGNAAKGTGGGGIYNSSSATIAATAIISNSAPSTSGYGGGGILNRGGYLTLVNSTVSGNSAGTVGGGITHRDGGRTNLNNVTIAFNTGTGFYHGAPYNAHLNNSILAGNVPTDCHGWLTSPSYILVQIATECILDGGSGNVTGVDPWLTPLQYRSPVAFHLPMAGSLTIDHGSPSQPGMDTSACEPVDQRGVPRPQGAVCDIGAVELEQADLELGLDDGPDPVQVQGQLALTSTVTNVGALTTTQVTLASTLPVGITPGEYITSQGSCGLSGSLLLCDLETVYPGGVATMTLVLTPTVPGAISTTTEVAGQALELDLIDNSATNTTVVTPFLLTLPLVVRSR
jgi:hypothetical protein